MQGSNDNIKEKIGIVSISDYLIFSSNPHYTTLEEEAKPLTAFTRGTLGFWECERMPFGLTNAPATCQRLMESCLGELHLSWCIIYLDDIMVFS